MKIKSIFILSILLLVHSFCLSQERIKIATYNILNYPNFANEKNQDFKLILSGINPDIVAVQEIQSQSAVILFRDSVLGTQYNYANYSIGFSNDNALFYKDSLFSIISVDFLPTSPRYIISYKLYHNFTLDTLVVYSAHFKAGNTSDDRANRENEAAIFRIFSDLLPANSNFMLIGDLNLYSATEPAYERLLNQNTHGYVLDPINRYGNWHVNSGFADIHTQSTRTAQLPDGGSNGGLDDRFDFILISEALNDSGGIEYINDTYLAYGNDGLHFNQQLINPPYPISLEIAFALHDVSDHLPVYAEFDFGIVSDVEVIEADEMNFVLHQNYPNPFNPTTNIRFQIADIRFVTLKIYDLLGNEVATLVSEEKPAGSYEVEFDGSNLPSGLYIYRLISQNYSASKKLMLLK